MDDYSKRLHVVLSLMDLGVAMRRQRFHREYPEDTEEQIDRRLRLWLSDRSGQSTAKNHVREGRDRA